MKESQNIQIVILAREIKTNLILLAISIGVALMFYSILNNIYYRNIVVETMEKYEQNQKLSSYQKRYASLPWSPLLEGYTSMSDIKMIMNHNAKKLSKKHSKKVFLYTLLACIIGRYLYFGLRWVEKKSKQELSDKLY